LNVASTKFVLAEKHDSQFAGTCRKLDNWAIFFYPVKTKVLWYGIKVLGELTTGVVQGTVSIKGHTSVQFKAIFLPLFSRMKLITIATSPTRTILPLTSYLM
jgi:hypothetical protein